MRLDPIDFPFTGFYLWAVWSYSDHLSWSRAGLLGTVKRQTDQDTYLLEEVSLL